MSRFRGPPVRPDARNGGSEDGSMQRIALATIVVPDYAEGIAFYVDRLDFALIENTDLGGGRRWVRVAPSAAGTTGAAEGATLLLAKADGPAQRARIGDQTGGRVAFFLETDDFARDHAAVLASGIVFTEEPRHEPYGTVAVWTDPFGNLWDLIEPKRP